MSHQNEAILLADVLGLSTLVQLQDSHRVMQSGGTEPALIGPFWRAHQPGSLVKEFKPHPQHPDELLLEVELMLEPGETRIPHPPLD